MRTRNPNARVEVHHRPDRERFEITLDGEVAGYAEYASHPGMRTFLHVVIEQDRRGRGLGGTLVAAALDATKSEDLEVEPVCPFVRDFLTEHSEYLELVPEERRAEFSLPTA